MPRDVGAIVVAGGQGTRFGGEIPKQYLPLAGVPVVARALRPFLMHPDVARVVLVLPAADVESPPAWLREMLGDRLVLARGGAVRTGSVRAGLAMLPADCGVVLVHDGARPLVDAATIDSVIAATRAHGSAIPALPVTETIKAAGPDGRVSGTVPRDGLWRVQTPQGFSRDLLTRAMAAHGDDPRFTDDAMLVEALGEPVHLVPGAPRNLKITTRDDLALAAWYLDNP